MPSANGKKLETILEDAATLTVVKTPEP